MMGQGWLWKEGGARGFLFQALEGPPMSQMSASSGTGTLASESCFLLFVLDWLGRAGCD